MSATVPDNAGTDQVPADIYDAAAYWHDRLQEEDTSCVREGFHTWCHQNPRHAAVFAALDAGLRHVQQKAIAPISLRHSLSSPRMRFEWSRPAFRIAGTALVLVLLVLAVPMSEWSDTPSTVEWISTSDQQRTVVLQDRSRVTLDAHTRLAIHFDARFRRVCLDSGQAWFEVAKDRAHPFIVEVGDRRVTAVGTAFDVHLIEPSKTVQVTLVEGRVNVDAATLSDHQELQPGDELIAEPARRATTRRADLAKALSWKSRILIFEDDSLLDALSQINRYARHRLSVADPSLEQLRIGGVFNAGSDRSFAESIASQYGLQVSESPDGGLVLSK